MAQVQDKLVLFGGANREQKHFNDLFSWKLKAGKRSHSEENMDQHCNIGSSPPQGQWDKVIVLAVTNNNAFRSERQEMFLHQEVVMLSVH